MYEDAILILVHEASIFNSFVNFLLDLHIVVTSLST
jgi:hypothetical protein